MRVSMPSRHLHVIQLVCIGSNFWQTCQAGFVLLSNPVLRIPLNPPSLLHTRQSSSRQHSFEALQKLAGHGGALAKLCLLAGQHVQLVAWLDGQGAAGQHVAKGHGYVADMRLWGYGELALSSPCPPGMHVHLLANWVVS